MIAGGGSFLTVPLLIFFGLPATEANATNRLGVLVQNIGGVWGFHRHRVLDWRWALRASLPALAGAVLGTWLALQVGDREFRRILATLMIGVTLWTLLDRGGRLAGALGRLRHKDVVLGPATDGGYYLVGLRAPEPRVFAGVNWGGETVLRETIENIRNCRLSLHVLPVWYDVDNEASLRHLETLMEARAIERRDRLFETEKVLKQIRGRD